MRKNRFSPSASVIMSLALALGILVADLTSVHTLTAARAQADGGGVSVAEATIYYEVIAAQDVLINGVPTSGVFVGSVKVVDALLLGDTTSAGGVHVNDSPTSATGVHVNDSTSSVSGVHVNDLSSTFGVHVNNSPYTVIGGVVEGTDIKVVDGVITGTDLRVVGAAVSGSLSNIMVTATGTTTTPME